MDAFEDLENPPSSVVAVLRNRWLSNSFKETVNKFTSHNSSMRSTYLMRKQCAFIFARLWQQLAGRSWKQKDVFSWWVDQASHPKKAPGHHIFDSLIHISTQVPDGFISHFYAISEHVSPVLAFGFLGPMQHLSEVCAIFKVRSHTIPDLLNPLWLRCMLIKLHLLWLW